MIKNSITIVIPVKNRSEIVGRTLKSISEQTFRPLSVVLVDNGSTDNTMKVLEDWGKANRGEDFNIMIISEPKPGAAAARNAGLAKVETPWTMFFDSDDIMLPTHISRSEQLISSHADTDLIGWDVRIHKSDNTEEIGGFTEKNLAYNSLMHGCLSTQRYVAKTELFRKAGGWRDDIRYWDDIELGSRLMQLHPRVLKTDANSNYGETVRVYFTPVSISSTSYSVNYEKGIKALEAIAESYKCYGPESHVNLKKIIFAADCVREGLTQARELYDTTLRHENKSINRLIYNIAYQWKLMGLPGAARIFGRFLV
ncbi:MAG: glycosyltransferase family 2 protein [Clostridium sp.]|nr:glycosyltransferase family 2 protein [Prevotella sp.]MCM1429347.1 glycosyltransferase family 2 protein [Clostridium sp.]MCM1475619.1 glycosyltransferase family 2 protein [Muribaculaceae bacterium]